MVYEITTAAQSVDWPAMVEQVSGYIPPLAALAGAVLGGVTAARHNRKIIQAQLQNNIDIVKNFHRMATQESTQVLKTMVNHPIPEERYRIPFDAAIISAVIMGAAGAIISQGIQTLIK